MKTLKLIAILACSFILICCSKKEYNRVKNVIILIPDGASFSLLTLARWHIDSEKQQSNKDSLLAFDPYICGIIRTHNANGTFPDSAPTSTAYATGVKTIAPYIGIDSSAHPRVSVLELARRKGLATGIVATCEFPHVTPADFVCHYNSREDGNYKNLAKQFIYNSPNLVFAGGERYLDEHGYNSLLKPNNIKLITDKNVFNQTNSLSDSCLWALFSGTGRYPTNYLAYECDRDTAKAPSLSEMTDKAINLLKQNKNGFFLMVEGSQIDWAAHSNDPYAAVTDVLEFNKAVAVALAFAKKDKNTVVIICPDHGTGGITIGNERSNNAYNKISINDSIIMPLRQIKKSGRNLAELALENSANISDDLLKKYLNAYNINEPTNDLLELIRSVMTGEGANEEEYIAKRDCLQVLTGRAFSKQNFIGWTTSGHTAEDVFLAIYAPKPVKKLTGMVDNYEIGKYIAQVLKLEDFDKTTEKLFQKHTKEHTPFFNVNDTISWNSDSLLIKKNGKILSLEPNSNILKIKGEKEVRLSSIVICINEIYYLPESIKDFL